MVTLRSSDNKLLNVDKGLLTVHWYVQIQWISITKPAEQGHSGFFRNLFELAQKSETGDADKAKEATSLGAAGDEAKPPSVERGSVDPDVLDIDVPAKDLGYFLDLLRLAQCRHLIDFRGILVDLEIARLILPVTDRFDCEGIAKLVKIRLGWLAAKDPWGVLHLASDRDDIDLAKKAICLLSLANVAPKLAEFQTKPKRNPTGSSYGQTQGWLQPPDPFFRQSLALLQPYWRLEMLQLMMTDKFDNVSGLSCVLDVDFQSLANRFNPLPM